MERIITMPYFMKNEEWYYYDGKKYQLTKIGKSIKKVVDSYNETYEYLEGE